MTIFETQQFERAYQAFAYLLVRYQSVWRPRPFVSDQCAWRDEFPSLYRSLVTLSDANLAELEEEAALVRFIVPHLPGIEQQLAWQIPASEAEIAPMPKFADVGIPGRKVEQICRFSGLVVGDAAIARGNIVDWCSGKGHLAKQLHYVTGNPVRCVEWDSRLCAGGEAIVAKLNYPITFHQHDILAQTIPSVVVSPAVLYTALHACGDLHITMLKQGIAQGVETIAWAPCCYHLTQKPHYQPLSQLGLSIPLTLSRTDLKLAVSQCVTGGKRVQRLRLRELQWRIAFDLFYRDRQGVDQYCPTPSIPKGWLARGFDEYCCLMAARIDWRFSGDICSERYLSLAQTKLAKIQRLEKARLAFRRVMEYFLLLDQILFVQEQGYRVSVRHFCREDVTPRNLAILAKMPG